MEIKFLLYLTIFPDLSVRSQTPTGFTSTLSPVRNATLHCSHLWTVLGHIFLSSLCTRSYIFPWILSGSSMSNVPLVGEDWFTLKVENTSEYNVINICKEHNTVNCIYSKPAIVTCSQPWTVLMGKSYVSLQEVHRHQPLWSAQRRSLVPVTLPFFCLISLMVFVLLTVALCTYRNS